MFYNNDVPAMIDGLKQLSPFWAGTCVAAAYLFILMEALVLACLLKEKDKKIPLVQCIKYSLTGYFYSGITPSASGGQPMQLIAMVQDGHKTSKSSAVLLVMAFYYKVFMVVVSLLLLMFWLPQIDSYFGAYTWLYHLGLALNVVIVIILAALMFFPKQTRGLINSLEQVLLKVKILKPNLNRSTKIDDFMRQYDHSVRYMFKRKRQILLLFTITTIQRLSLMFIPVFIYLGLPLEGEDLYIILLIQSATYVAVDMMPLPGAQGITEVIILQSLGTIFTAKYIGTTMILTRATSFYILLITGLIVVALNQLMRYMKRKNPPIST